MAADDPRYRIEEDPVFSEQAVEAPFLGGASRDRHASFEERTGYNDIPEYGGPDDDDMATRNNSTAAPSTQDSPAGSAGSAGKPAAQPQLAPPPPPPQQGALPQPVDDDAANDESEKVLALRGDDRQASVIANAGDDAGSPNSPPAAVGFKARVIQGGKDVKQGTKGFLSELFDAKPFFDANGNGRLDPLDFPGVALGMQVAVPVATADTEAGQQEGQAGGAAGEVPGAGQPVKMQKLPLFIIFQTSAVLGPWVIEFFKHLAGGGEDRGLGDIKVGFESLFPGSTDLLLTWDCEDYRGHFWRWFTYQWTHVGIGHVLTNTVLCLTIGIALEGFHGTWLTAAIFNLGVFGGAMCYRVFDAHESVVGMSAGCYAFMGMFLATTLMNWKQMKYPRARLLYLLFIAGFDFLQATLVQPKEDNSVPSYSVHFGGYAVGLLLGITQGRNLVLEEWERTVKYVAAAVAAVLFLFSFSWGMVWPPRNLFESEGWCWVRQVQSTALFGDNSWHCVKCASEACMNTYKNEEYVSHVSISLCDDVYGWDTANAR